MINKIRNKSTIEAGKQQKAYRVIIKDEETGEVLYDHPSKGGVLCSMEQIYKMTAKEIEGNHQAMGWGHVFTQVYGRDMLDNFINEKTPEILEEMKKQGIKIDPIIEDAINKSNKK